MENALQERKGNGMGLERHMLERNHTIKKRLGVYCVFWCMPASEGI